MASTASAMLRRAVQRSVAPSLSLGKPTALPVSIRSATTKAASPETPLMHYTSTQQATSSINHRIFYVNVVAMVLVYDIGSSMLDI
eukprot:CAMPEP_0197647440 /NCGR_PEP_ID=MMETSP1338-20131121/25375_1 /TAXON_ID=43686 ORGANISM="Pelagodinium beii, Strain RCC1491" /NCGR_SAMPLE_ID=MMETSP1338 /ASSEMBLY_ACC=CAM_ASM_000754 /LENGTH=85 /DNA_ID=CAMNT_0043221235 /DNA_START=39 /DNA_END=296 /DNA_ORIENTATION=+